MTPAQLHAVLFDLDGTLSDSAACILASLRHAFATHGLAPLSVADERDLLGPPLHQALPPLIGTQPYAEVFATFAAHQDAGARLKTSLFPGMRDVLDGLRATGRTLAVATSKHEPGARQVVEHLGIADYFATVCGEQHGGPRDSKGKVVAEVLRRTGADPSTTVLVGDRANDALGAAENGVAFIGAGWGYAAPGELHGAGAQLVCATPAELAATLGAGCDAAAS
jgi:phosphoglycolate phosphatase